MADTARSSWLQFSLRTLLWIMLCVAIGIAAYRRGFEAGTTDAINKRRLVVNPQFRVYDLTEIVRSGPRGQADLDILVSDLTAKVLPNTWVDRGGAASIAIDQRVHMLIVSHDQDGHKRIVQYLDQRRQRPKQNQQLTSK